MDLYSEIGTYAPDNLIAGENVPIQFKGVTIIAGQGILKRGSVLGLVLLAVGAPTAKEGNTGTGVPEAISLKSKSKLGTYTLICTAAAANSGTFAVCDPEGNRLADATVAVAYVSNQINFTITDATDFIVGDEIYIPVIAGSGKGKLAAKAAVDGSNVAKYILSDDVDATLADAVVQCYASGLFNREALIFAADNTAADHEDRLRDYGIFLKDNIAY